MQLSASDCQTCPLNHRCVWKDVGAIPSVGLVPRIYHDDQSVFRTGDPCLGLYVVRSGLVRTSWIGADGAEQILGFHYPGTVFGVESLAEGVHATGAESVGTSSVCILESEKLAAACAGSPALITRLLALVASVAGANERVQVSLGARNAAQRIAAFLLDTSRQQHERGGSATEIWLPMRRRDIARHLALAGETVSRIFAKLEANGAVRIDRRDRHRIRIGSLEALARIAEPSGDGELGAVH